MEISVLMKKYFCFLVFFISFISYSQSKYTAEQVEESTDPEVIVNFIKYNPNHPKTQEFKLKLISIIVNLQEPVEMERLGSEPKIKLQGREINAEEGKQLLDHFFKSDYTEDAYLQIINKSNCDMMMEISGKELYQIEVKANDKNFIILKKGNYTLSSLVCDSQYFSEKNIEGDMEITLNTPK